MAAINLVMVDLFHVVERDLAEHLRPRALDGTQSTTIHPNPTPITLSASTILPAQPTMSSSSSTPSSGPTSSPLLFFVALGFGVVFTNLWIIVGVKYCFRYNARNRALRNGEEVDPINLENMPTRPHRRRREKKLMTMDEVNERFPLTKYKNWVAGRASEGLPTAGGVAATTSRPASVRDVDGVVPSSPTGTKNSVNTRPETAGSDRAGAEVTISPATNALGGVFGSTGEEKGTKSPAVEETNRLEEVQTTTSTVNKHATVSGEDDDDEDDHIHTAVPPELLTNPGDSCAICIDTLEDDDDIRGLTCGHAFHAGCLDPWLTSRRACCPLCKADYYTPKPRPEGEVVEADRSGRRREGRTAMPHPPPSAWTGLRGNPRLIFPGRFGSAAPAYAGDATNNLDGSRQARRARRAAANSEVAGVAEASPTATGNPEVAPSRRWAPRITNPFSSMSMPTIRLPGRNRQDPAATSTTAEASPSQLEAGIIR